MPSLLLNAQEVELLRALTDCEVRYLVIGGHAVIFHGYLRPAKDLDVWIEPNLGNAKKTAQALQRVWISLSSSDIDRLAEPNLQMSIQVMHTELLNSVAGLDFNVAMTRSVKTFEQETCCHVLGREDLIATKRVLARPQDVEDIACLENSGGA